MSKRTGRALVMVGAAAVIALQGAMGGMTPAFATTSNDSCFISAINSARASDGLGALGVNLALEAVATTWAQSMATTQVLSHNLNLPNLAPSDWMNLGENVGEGPSCSAIATAFMNSPEHKANILDTAYSVVGVGVVLDGNGTMWVTEDFMGTGAAAPSNPAPAPQPVTPSTPPPAPAHTTAPAPVHTTAPAPAPVHITAPAPAPVHTTPAPKPVTPSTPAAAATTPPPAPAPSPTVTEPAPQLANPITITTPATPIVQVMARTESVSAHPKAAGHKDHVGVVHHVLSSIASFFSHLL